MAKTKDGLTAEIDAVITANGTGDITGPVLNAVLKSMVGSLSGGYFLYPAHASLSESDIGKVVMNDGSGEAKVYQLGAATTEQTGRYILRLEDLDDLSDDSALRIDSLTYGDDISRATWRNGNTPTTALEELELIKDYLDGNPSFSNLNTSIVDDELIIEEDTYNYTQIETMDFPFMSLEVDTISRPALPAAPTAFPLGKLIGLDGANAIISSVQVETYTLEGTATLNNSFYNNATDIDFTNIEDLVEVAKFLAVPTSDGKVKQFDVNDLNFDKTIKVSLRHHFLGLIVGSTSSTITVINMNSLSFILNFITRLAGKGLLGSN